MKRSNRVTMPLLLTGIGIVLLIGCIPIPATRQFQPDGSLRPEYAIGKNKEVRLGETTIDDAFIALSKRVNATSFVNSIGTLARTGQSSGAWSIRNWTVSPDDKRFSLEYSVRTTTWILPLCFTTMQDVDKRWLTLDLDDNGIVIKATTTKQPPGNWPTPDKRWLKIFDESMRRKLIDAAVFPTEEQMEEQQRLREQYLKTLRPATSPSSRPVH